MEEENQVLWGLYGYNIINNSKTIKFNTIQSTIKHN